MRRCSNCGNPYCECSSTTQYCDAWLPSVKYAEEMEARERNEHHVSEKEAKLLEELGMKVEWITWWSATENNVKKPKTTVNEAIDWIEANTDFRFKISWERNPNGVLLTMVDIVDVEKGTEVCSSSTNQGKYGALVGMVEQACLYWKDKIKSDDSGRDNSID